MKENTFHSFHSFTHCLIYSKAIKKTESFLFSSKAIFKTWILPLVHWIPILFTYSRKLLQHFSPNSHQFFLFPEYFPPTCKCYHFFHEKINPSWPHIPSSFSYSYRKIPQNCCLYFLSPIILLHSLLNPSHPGFYHHYFTKIALLKDDNYLHAVKSNSQVSVLI